MGYPLWGQVSPFGRLNESPSEKEGKWASDYGCGLSRAWPQ